MNNLFEYATSELSQDAFICWLINWVNYQDHDPNLHDLSKDFLNTLISKGNVKPPRNYQKVEIKRQYEKIDVFVRVNDEHVLIIEDKVNSGPNIDAMKNYINCSIDKLFKTSKFLLISLKYRVLMSSSPNTYSSIFVSPLL